jgi:hypothetical protein
MLQENLGNNELDLGKKNEFVFIALAILIAGFIAKIPQLQGVREDLFYEKNVSFIFLPLLMIYFNWKNQLSWNYLIFPFVVISLSLVYVNILPNSEKSDSNSLIYFHLPILTWILLGFSFVGSGIANFKNGILFLRFTANLVVMSVIILLSGFLFMAMTMGLFKLIGIDTAYLVQHYVLIWGLPSIPLMASFIVTNNPQIVNKISPIIAKIFTPMVTLMLFLFLFGIIVTGKNPTQDREFLLILNALLVGVMALIIFSLQEMTKSGKQAIQLYTLLALSAITILINCLALYSILFRLVEFGFSANRVAVIGADIFIFTHLLLLTRKLILFNQSKVSVTEVENTAGNYLPVYFVWVSFVVFVLPFIFDFK